LLFPRLVLEQQSRLASSAGELAQIDRRLAHLYAMRDDVVNVTNRNKGSGATGF
jgi:hypothetical protein